MENSTYTQQSPTRQPPESLRDRTDGRTAAQLLRELRDELTSLFRQETQLFKVEIEEKFSRLSRNAIYAMAGGLIAFAGIMILLLAVTAGLYGVLWAYADLTHTTSSWLAPLIVGGVVATIGFALIQKAKSTFKKEPVTPERTVQTIKDQKEWMKEKARQNEPG
jgi:uncharacterized membrane protein